MDFFDSSHPMLSFERELWDGSFSLVAGVDEAGRGPLAGPVVAAAVIFDKTSKIPPVNDSKKLSHKNRDKLYDQILLSAVKYSIVRIESQEIDLINILQATHKAMREALKQLESAEFALVDGLNVPALPVPAKFIVKGDSKSASIAAASILAKVYRDRIMDGYSELYPEYFFNENRGYGTAKHIKALEKYGISPIHRKTFEPIKSMLNENKIIQMEFNII